MITHLHGHSTLVPSRSWSRVQHLCNIQQKNLTEHSHQGLLKECLSSPDHKKCHSRIQWRAGSCTHADKFQWRYVQSCADANSYMKIIPKARAADASGPALPNWTKTRMSLTISETKRAALTSDNSTSAVVTRHGCLCAALSISCFDC